MKKRFIKIFCLISLFFLIFSFILLPSSFSNEVLSKNSPSVPEFLSFSNIPKKEIKPLNRILNFFIDVDKNFNKRLSFDNSKNDGLILFGSWVVKNVPEGSDLDLMQIVDLGDIYYKDISKTSAKITKKIDRYLKQYLKLFDKKKDKDIFFVSHTFSYEKVQEEIKKTLEANLNNFFSNNKSELIYFYVSPIFLNFISCKIDLENKKAWKEVTILCFYQMNFFYKNAKYKVLICPNFFANDSNITHIQFLNKEALKLFSNVFLSRNEPISWLLIGEFLNLFEDIKQNYDKKNWVKVLKRYQQIVDILGESFLTENQRIELENFLKFWLATDYSTTLVDIANQLQILNRLVSDNLNFQKIKIARNLLKEGYIENIICLTNKIIDKNPKLKGKGEIFIKNLEESLNYKKKFKIIVTKDLTNEFNDLKFLSFLDYFIIFNSDLGFLKNKINESLLLLEEMKYEIQPPCEKIDKYFKRIEKIANHCEKIKQIKIKIKEIEFEPSLKKEHQKLLISLNSDRFLKKLAPVAKRYSLSF